MLAWRLESGLSQRAAARKAGLSQPTWTKLEGNRASRVSVGVAALLELVTSGAVTVADFVLEALPRPRRRRGVRR